MKNAPFSARFFVFLKNFFGPTACFEPCFVEMCRSTSIDKIYHIFYTISKKFYEIGGKGHHEKEKLATRW